MDNGTKKRTLQKLHYGMYVMTSRSGAQCCAATVTWLSQASFHPPLVMAAVRRGSHLFKCLSESGIAVINILAQARLDVARKFFSGAQSTGESFDDEPFTAGTNSAPVLQSACAFMECRVCRMLDSVGDHAVVIMEVMEAQCREDAQPLTVAELPWKYAG